MRTEKSAEFARIAVETTYTERPSRGGGTPQPGLTKTTPTCIGVVMAEAKNSGKRAYRFHGDWNNRNAPEDVRFWEKVDKSGDCWIWTAATIGAGYGYFGSDFERYAHRWAYRKLIGEIPPGYEIDHLCRAPSCVNPEHLEAVTPAENQRRKNEATPPRTHCRKGHERTPETVYVNPRGVTTCIPCRRAADRERYRRNAAKSGGGAA